LNSALLDERRESALQGAPWHGIAENLCDDLNADTFRV
jgi:hypothetical protein